MSDADCLFCQMARGAFPVDKLHEDGLVFAIRDINPRAPIHVLVIPKQHIPTAGHLTNDHGPLLAHMFLTAANLMRDLDIADNGYRLAINVGADGGQSVYHLHMHVLGGHRLGAEG
ncbi:MAG: HIT domain-containing protein [Dehalococcoidia bacterium]|nr:HIT domain-containing protein [Dehalococcoidia bacterium]